MLFAIVLAITWLILLIRYPSRALPVSLAALSVLALLVGWVIWQEQRQQQHLQNLEISMQFDPQHCPASRPLALNLRNGSTQALQSLSWKVSAYAPLVSANLVENRYADAHYQGSGALQPGAHWQDCMALPPLRAGYRASSLAFRAEHLRGHFAD